jgi:hypothetical protein
VASTAYKDSVGVRLISRNRKGRDLDPPRGARHARSMCGVGTGALLEERPVS